MIRKLSTILVALLMGLASAMAQTGNYHVAPGFGFQGQNGSTPPSWTEFMDYSTFPPIMRMMDPSGTGIPLFSVNPSTHSANMANAINTLTPISFGTITDGGYFGDGLSHPASGNGFSTLAALQAKYSFATALSNDMAGLMIQAAIKAADAAANGTTVLIPYGSFRTLPTGWSLPANSTARVLGLGWVVSTFMCQNAGTNPCFSVLGEASAGIVPIAGINFQGLNTPTYPGNPGGVPVASLFNNQAVGLKCFGCSLVTFERLRFANFDLPLDWDTVTGNNYIITFRDSLFVYNNKGYSINLAAPNSFEKMICDNCTIGNNNYGVWVNTTGGANFIGSAGATFTGVGSGTNLTVSGVTGYISTGNVDTITGTGIPGGTTIVSQTSGTPHGAGVYVTNNATTVNGAVTDNSTQLIVSTLISGTISAPNSIYGYNIPGYYQISGGTSSPYTLNTSANIPSEQMSTEGATSGADIFFVNSSIDYNNVYQAVFIGGGTNAPDLQSRMSFRGSHIETSGAVSGTSTYRIINSGNMTFNDDYFYENGSNPIGEVYTTFYSCTGVFNSQLPGYSASDNAVFPFIYTYTNSQPCVSASGNSGRVSQYTAIMQPLGTGFISANDWIDASYYKQGTSFTLALAHQRKTMLLTATGLTITIPKSTTSFWAQGQWVDILAPTGITATIAGAVGVTVSGTTSMAAGTKARLTNTGTDTWQITY